MLRLYCWVKISSGKQSGQHDSVLSLTLLTMDVCQKYYPCVGRNVDDFHLLFAHMYFLEWPCTIYVIRGKRDIRKKSISSQLIRKWQITQQKEWIGNSKKHNYKWPVNMNRYPTQLVSMEIQMKPTQTLNFSPIGLKRVTINKCCRGCGKADTFIFYWGESEIVPPSNLILKYSL